MILALLVEPPPSTTAGIITASATIIGSVATLIVAITGFVLVLRNVGKVHTIVNQQATDSDRYNIAVTQHALGLAALLDAAGIPHPSIPIDQSKPVPGLPDAQPGQPT